MYLKSSKSLILFVGALSILLSVAACGGKKQAKMDTNSLEGKKARLNQLISDREKISDEIQVLQAEIIKLDTSAIRSLEVTTMKVVQKDFAHTVDLQGAVYNNDPGVAASETGGRITSLTVKEGDYVKAGQLIATVDMETLRKTIEEVETSLSLAKDVYARQESLWKQQVGSEIQYLQAKNSVESIEKRIATLRSSLDKANVYAPMGGVIDKVLYKQGEVCPPGMPIVMILNLSSVKVKVEVPENYLPIVKTGQSITVKFPAINQETSGRISAIGRMINPGNRTFTVEMEVSNSSGMLKPNLLAVMSLQDYTQKDAVVVPAELVLQDIDGKDFLYVVKTGPDGPKAHKATVVRGNSSSTETIITSGLAAGDEVIVKGNRSASEGIALKIIQN